MVYVKGFRPMLKRSQVNAILARCADMQAAGHSLHALAPGAVATSALEVKHLCESLLDAWDDYHSHALPETIAPDPQTSPEGI